MMKTTLKLNEFKALYKALKTGVVFIDYLLFGLLVWIEEKLIDNRVRVELDEAIEEYKTLHETDLPDMVSPLYTEKPSDTSTSLPEMRLTAPWYIDTYDEK
jgi:hypothetical protein